MSNPTHSSVLPACNGSECGDNGYGLRTHSVDCARAKAFRELEVDMGAML